MINADNENGKTCQSTMFSLSAAPEAKCSVVEDQSDVLWQGSCCWKQREFEEMGNVLVELFPGAFEYISSWGQQLSLSVIPTDYRLRLH